MGEVLISGDSILERLRLFYELLQAGIIYDDGMDALRDAIEHLECLEFVKLAVQEGYDLD